MGWEVLHIQDHVVERKLVIFSSDVWNTTERQKVLILNISGCPFTKSETNKYAVQSIHS